MEAKACLPIDQSKIKQELMETDICVKVEEFKEKSKYFEPKLDCIKEDMLHYEPRETPAAKIKLEPIQQKDSTLGDFTGQSTICNIKTEAVNNTDNIGTCGTETLSVTTNNLQESFNETWKPISMTKVADYYRAADDNLDTTGICSSKQGGETRVDINTKAKFHTLDFISTGEASGISNRETQLKQPRTNIQEKMQAKLDNGHKQKQNIKFVDKSKENNTKSSSSQTSSASFKDPNKVLDTTSYIYRKKETNLKRTISTSRNSSTVNDSNDFKDTYTYAEKLKNCMEKKHIPFVNKRTKQRRETFLTYFDNFGIEIILVSDKDNDRTELYNRNEDPATFYRLFYNFIKASQCEPRPDVTDKEVEVLSTYIKECKQKERKCEFNSKRPRLTSSRPVQNVDGDIVSSARRMAKTRNGLVTENFDQPSSNFMRPPRSVSRSGNGLVTDNYAQKREETQTNTVDTSNRYWDLRGKRYMHKDNWNGRKKKRKKKKGNYAKLHDYWYGIIYI